MPAGATGNVVRDPGFESGGFTAGWHQCGTSSTKAMVTTARPHSGTHSALIGAVAKPELNGKAGVCQTIAVPANATLAFWVYEGTNDTIAYADQEADVLDSSGAQLAQLYKEAANSAGWVRKSYSLAAYAGKNVTLFFGVKGNGWASGYIYEYVDDVYAAAGTAPSPSPTTSPTSSPTTQPTSAPYACKNAQFVAYQREFGNGSISNDQFVDVCGIVKHVLPKQVTASGPHGYFYVAIPGSASPGTIEIVSNLQAMAQAPDHRPPGWPWVKTGDYVYVQGRYYYDNASSQGIDWTEDDSSSSWPHVGYVAVCAAAGTSCIFYH